MLNNQQRLSSNGVPATATSGAPSIATKDGEKAPVSSFTSYMQAKAGKTGNAYLVPAENAALVSAVSTLSATVEMLWQKINADAGNPLPHQPSLGGNAEVKAAEQQSAQQP